MRRLLPVMMMVLAGCPSNGQDANGSAVAQVAPPFSAAAAFQHVRTQVGFGPRVAGMPGHQKQLEWMREYLRARADSVTIQSFEHTTTRGQKKTLAMSNVIAHFNPQNTERVLLVAHWDTRPTADSEWEDADRNQPIPGANDGASGTAVLLEIANVLSKTKPKVGVDLLFVDGEDYGPGEPDMYLGAKHFAANAGGYRPLYAVLVDMVGDRTPEFPIEANSNEMAPEVVQRVWGLAEELGFSRYFPRNNAGAITDDHVWLNQAGIRTANIIDCCEHPWHTLQDNLENASSEGLGVVGTVLLELIFREGR